MFLPFPLRSQKVNQTGISISVSNFYWSLYPSGTKIDANNIPGI